MNDREKLIALIENAKRAMKSENLSCNIARNGFVADFLISNGVTIQRWIPVTERLPERTMPPHDVLVYHDLKCGMFVDRAWYEHGKGKWRSFKGMNLKVTHWMPIPEPPKEVE